MTDDGWDAEQDPGYYDEIDDRTACYILYAWLDSAKQGAIPKALKEQLNEDLNKLVGPIRRHETARLLYFLTDLDEHAIARLIDVPPFFLNEAFEPWDVLAGCDHKVRVDTRRRARRPPEKCRMCRDGAEPQRLFVPPRPTMGWAAYEARFRRPDWRLLRRRKLREQPACALCAATEHLDVHHNTYVRFGRERLSDLTVLCRDCHNRHHEEMKRRLN